MTTLNPYISFGDTAREAMEFYQSVFGGELTLNTFEDSPVSDDPADKDKILHGMLTTTGGMVLMGADTPSSMEISEGSAITISLSGEEEAELRGYWDKLSAGASNVVPLEQAPWGDHFGMCTDKFGVGWMVNIGATK